MSFRESEGARVVVLVEFKESLEFLSGSSIDGCLNFSLWIKDKTCNLI